ncbi:uncharacterized protein LOC121405801 [Lytechinus variegatus]|uniref:uncharacterized protein LOC121405801 n=1 Tax=Lytechinus variegatus TaxID=7654 RepID=UPI001BB1F29A|nr:uncharacterized protein LOC121405801 [Lytechinus variegatus]
MDSFNGENFVKEMDNGMLSVQSRIKVVRILVSWLIQEFTSKPPTDVKVALAKAVVSQFPKLKDLEGVGHEAWYSPAREKREASGYLEYRLVNVRKRAQKSAPITSEPK